jgi:amino acid transporter
MTDADTASAGSKEERMSDLRAARLTGVLFIIATVADLLGAAVRPGLAGTDYLTGLAAQPDRVAAGALLLLIAAFACAGIAIAMYPVLRRTDTGMALGSVVFRTLEAVMYMIAVVSLLSLSTLGQATVASGATDQAALGAVGGLLLGLRDHAALIGVFAFALGAFLYYVVLFRARLIPRWLSGWGIAAIGLLVAMAVLALFTDRPVTSFPLLAFPIFLQEMVLAVWLIVRGFSQVREVAPDAGTAAGRTATAANTAATLSAAR